MMVDIDLQTMVVELRREATDQILEDPTSAYAKLDEANTLVRVLVKLNGHTFINTIGNNLIDTEAKVSLTD